MVFSEYNTSGRGSSMSSSSLTHVTRLTVGRVSVFGKRNTL